MLTMQAAEYTEHLIVHRVHRSQWKSKHSVQVCGEQKEGYEHVTVPLTLGEGWKEGPRLKVLLQKHSL